jgi:hypothetical protein
MITPLFERLEKKISGMGMGCCFGVREIHRGKWALLPVTTSLYLFLVNSINNML